MWFHDELKLFLLPQSLPLSPFCLTLLYHECLIIKLFYNNAKRSYVWMLTILVHFSPLIHTFTKAINAIWRKVIIAQQFAEVIRLFFLFGKLFIVLLLLCSTVCNAAIVCKRLDKIIINCRVLKR